MTNYKHSWPAGDIDAINIKVSHGKLDIQGIDDGDITLEGDPYERPGTDIRVDTTGRWLKINIPHVVGSKVSLKVPRKKPG